MATQIIVTKKGSKCPNCKRYNMLDSALVKDVFEDDHIIKAYKCACGTCYVNQDDYGRYGLGELLYVYTNGQVIKSTMAHMPKKIRRKYVKGVTAKRTVQCCKECGKPECFSDSNLCWECYKYEKEKMFG